MSFSLNFAFHFASNTAAFAIITEVSADTSEGRKAPSIIERVFSLTQSFTKSAVFCGLEKSQTMTSAPKYFLSSSENFSFFLNLSDAKNRFASANSSEFAGADLPLLRFSKSSDFLTPKTFSSSACAPPLEERSATFKTSRTPFGYNTKFSAPELSQFSNILKFSALPALGLKISRFLTLSETEASIPPADIRFETSAAQDAAKPSAAKNVNTAVFMQNIFCAFL